jgi:hypothetical protein
MRSVGNSVAGSRQLGFATFPERLTCSRRRHHIWVIATKLAAMVDSNIPKRNRQIMRPIKLCAAAPTAVHMLPDPDVSVHSGGGKGRLTSKQVEQDPPLDGEFHERKRTERLEGELSNVDDGCQPTVLLALQVRRFP